MLILFAWLLFQGVVTEQGVYSDTLEMLPPMIFLLGILPCIVFFSWLFLSPTGKSFLRALSVSHLSFVHIVRIPVEFVLLWLCLHGVIPVLMTFEGWNFDILMGLSAPLILYYGYYKNRVSKTLLLAWNVIGMLMLAFIFIIAVMSAPFPLQQLAFDEPNIALLAFPYSWLPTFIVPIAFATHIKAITELRKKSTL